MKIVIDTHALFWYLVADKKLSQTSKIALDNALKINIPTIVLVELFYLMKKKGLNQEFPKLFHKIKKDSRLLIISFDVAIFEKVTEYNLKLEIHDNIITTTAKVLNLPLVTKDPQIQKVYKNTIW